MAEQVESSDDNWFGSWFQAAKEKSAEVLGYIRQDLGEFTQTVQQEASSVVTSATSALKDKLTLNEENTTTVKNMASSVSSFLGQVSSAFRIPPDDEDEQTMVVQGKEEPLLLDQLQAQVMALAAEPRTFLEDAEESESEYEKWLQTFDLEEKQAELPDLMVANPNLQEQYVVLVPAKVSHTLFWHRYFFRLHLMENAEAGRQILKEKVKQTQLSSDNIHWDEDEKFGGDVDISEEEQERLLAEYEKECSEKDSSNQSKDEDDIETVLKRSPEEDDVKSTDGHSLNEMNLEHELKISQKKEEQKKTVEKEKCVDMEDGEGTLSQESSSGVGSNDDEWEKEFEVSEGEGKEVEGTTDKPIKNE